jgi:FkbM family methyltransferase
MLQKVKTFLENPGIQREYLHWQATKITTGYLPYVELPQGERLFPADRFNDFHAINTQHPDDSEFRLVKSLLSETSGGVFIDVGANVGAMTLLAHSTGLASSILAFEPSHRYCLAWHHNMSANKVNNATLIQAAVGDRCGEVNFRVDPHLPLNNKIDHGNVHFSTQVQKVKIVTLDSICAATNLDQVSLLKIDVEGAEPMVIRGAKELLLRHQVNSILLEFIVEFIEDMDENPYDFVNLLTDYGYDFYAINSDGTLGESLNPKSIVDERRVSPDHPLRPFHEINLVAKLRG